MTPALLPLHPALADIATPALILDETTLRANIDAMAGFAREAGIALRPHVKTHKSSAIARMQVEAGALGVGCATLLEAEAMAAGGVRDLLITSPLAEPGKARRAAALARSVTLSVVLDHPAQVELLEAALGPDDRVLDVLIDVDVGQRRTGIVEIAEGVALARRVRAAKGLRLRGLQGFGGHIQHTVGAQARRALALAASEQLKALARALREDGMDCAVISGSGTGAHATDASGAYTELQVGSYVFMDADYRRLEWDAALPFAQSLFVLATVVSANRPDQCTVDAGVKALAFNGPAPDILRGAPDGTRYQFAGDEHGILTLPAGAAIPVGARILIAATHCDPTVNLHAAYHLVGQDGQARRMPIEGRYG